MMQPVIRDTFLLQYTDELVCHSFKVVNVNASKMRIQEDVQEGHDKQLQYLSISELYHHDPLTKRHGQNTDTV